MKNLVYTRIEYREGQIGTTVKRHTTRVHCAPAMPDGVDRLNDTSWRRVTTAKHLEVIESWRLLDAARLVA